MDLTQKLITASRDGNIVLLQELLQQGGDETKKAVNGKDRYGISPLMWASQWGHPDCVVALLAAGADPNFRDGVRSHRPLPRRQHGQLFVLFWVNSAFREARRRCPRLLAWRSLSVSRYSVNCPIASMFRRFLTCESRFYQVLIAGGADAKQAYKYFDEDGIEAAVRRGEALRDGVAPSASAVPATADSSSVPLTASVETAGPTEIVTCPCCQRSELAALVLWRAYRPHLDSFAAKCSVIDWISTARRRRCRAGMC